MVALRFTSWARLEPTASDPDLSPGLVAETADPLWFLGRQWQLGEFWGEDTGTPATVSVSAWHGRPEKVRLGESAVVSDYSSDRAPLDVYAEAEPAPADPGVLVRAEAGLMIADEIAAVATAAAPSAST